MSHLNSFNTVSSHYILRFPRLRPTNAIWKTEWLPMSNLWRKAFISFIAWFETILILATLGTNGSLWSQSVIMQKIWCWSRLMALVGFLRDVLGRQHIDYFINYCGNSYVGAIGEILPETIWTNQENVNYDSYRTDINPTWRFLISISCSS